MANHIKMHRQIKTKNKKFISRTKMYSKKMIKIHNNEKKA